MGWRGAALGASGREQKAGEAEEAASDVTQPVCLQPAPAVRALREVLPGKGAML